MKYFKYRKISDMTILEKKDELGLLMFWIFFLVPIFSVLFHIILLGTK